MFIEVFLKILVSILLVASETNLAYTILGQWNLLSCASKL